MTRPGPPWPAPPAPPPATPTSGLAVAGILLSVCSLVALVLSLGLSFAISLPLAAGGWMCASRARRRGAAGQGQAARVLAMVGVALSITAMVVWLVLIVAGFTPEELQRDLERELERQRHSSDPVTRLRELRAAAAVILGR